MAAWGFFAARSLSRALCPSRGRRMMLGAVLGATALTGVRPTSLARPTATAAAERMAQNYYFLPEVRLRKFHLVRPDLIPYPITYEVYC